MKTYILKRNDFSSSDIIDRIEKGEYPLCPVCKSPILVAYNMELVKKLKSPPGMVCSKDRRHFDVEFIFPYNKFFKRPAENAEPEGS